MIPDEAVEAALEVSLRQLGLWGKELPEDLVDARRVRIAEILEAAAPYLMAKAWDEAAEKAADIAWEHDASASSAILDIPNPYRSQE